jgi:hypothetical protein
MLPRGDACRPGMRVLMTVMAGLLLCTPSLILAQESSDMPVSIEVVPLDSEKPEDGPGPWAPPQERQGITISTIIRNVVPIDGRDDAYAVDLVVVDARYAPAGWLVTLGQMTSSSNVSAPMLDGYLRRTEALDGRTLIDGRRPHGVRTSIGQPLDRTTPVMRAPVGTDPGAYTVRFGITGVEPQEGTTLNLSSIVAP